MPQVEILSPAGSMESFRAAINAGADAVYMGGNMFGARAYASNFGEEELKRALEIAHVHGRKVYLTVNTLLKNDEIENKLYDFLRPAYENGLDAVLVQDFGVFEFIRRNFPEIDIHASTQMTTNGTFSARLLQEKGATRIVTSRELSLEEIRAIRRETSLEIESFVHGALCYCYSGQCLLSGMIGTRSGNRGRCAQPCRLKYTACDRDGDVLGKKDLHVLSPKDMCALELLPDIIDAGVYSLKIEGRMKSPEYTAGVVAVYRKYVDLYLALGRVGYQVNPKDVEVLMDLFNRGNFSHGYYLMQNGPQMMSMERPNHQGTRAIEVLSSDKRNMKVKALNDLNPQDVVDVSPEFTWTNGQERKRGEIFSIHIPGNLRVKNGSVFYRVRNNALLKEIDERYLDKNIKEKVMICGTFRLGQKACVSISCGGFCYEAQGNIVEKAINSPMDKEQIEKQLSKLGNTEFVVEKTRIEADENIFVPVQELNELRRKLVAGLTEQMTGIRTIKSHVADDVDAVKKNSLQTGNCVHENHARKMGIFVTVYDEEMLSVVLQVQDVQRVYFEMSETEFKDLNRIAGRIKEAGKEAFLVLPYIFRKNVSDIFERNLIFLKNAGFDGFLIKNLDELSFLMENEVEGKRILEYNIYQFNDRARDFFDNMEIDGYTVSTELSRNEICKMDNSRREMIVYGYLPVMVSAQCIMKNFCGCKLNSDREAQVLYLKDRMGKRMPVINQCAWCYNVIYDSSPLNLLAYAGKIKECSIKAVRIDLRFLKEKEAGEILSGAVEAFVYDRAVDVKGDFTKGHFLRGVE